MGRNKKPKLMPSLMEKDSAKNSFFMKWWVIIVSLMLIWPIGMILLITKTIGIVKENKAAKLAMTDKIPFANRKSQELRTLYGACTKRYRKKILTVILCSVLFIGCGIYGTTKSIVLMIFQTGINQKKIMDTISYLLFLYVGIYFLKSCIDTIQQNSRIHRINGEIGTRQSVDINEIAEKLSYNLQTVRDDVNFMLDNAWFGVNAYFDAEKNTIHTWS